MRLPIKLNEAGWPRWVRGGFVFSDPRGLVLGHPLTDGALSDAMSTMHCGKNFKATVTNTGLVLSSRVHSASGALAPAAVDSLFEQGLISSVGDVNWR